MSEESHEPRTFEEGDILDVLDTAYRVIRVDPRISNPDVYVLERANMKSNAVSTARLEHRKGRLWSLIRVDSMEEETIEVIG